MKEILSEREKLFIAVAFFLIVIVLIRMIVGWIKIRPELKYLNCEIHRTSGDERKHWERKKKRLLISFFHLGIF